LFHHNMQLQFLLLGMSPWPFIDFCLHFRGKKN